MKKFFAILLALALLASLSVSAFASETVPDPEEEKTPVVNPSPEKEVPVAPSYDNSAVADTSAAAPADNGYVAPVTEEEPTIVEDVSIVAAEELAAAIEDTGIADADEVPEDADNDVKTVVDQAEQAEADLTVENVDAAISGNPDVVEMAKDKVAVCSKPFILYSKDGNYPATVSFNVEDIDTLLVYVDGEWVMPEGLSIVEKDDGTFTVTCTIDEAVLGSIVNFR